MLTRCVLAAAALAAAASVTTGVVRYRRLHRVLQRERVAHRLMDGCLHRDVEALHVRLAAVVARQDADRAVLHQAAVVVDEALAVHSAGGPHDLIDPYDPFQEGGPS